MASARRFLLSPQMLGVDETDQRIVATPVDRLIPGGNQIREWIGFEFRGALQKALARAGLSQPASWLPN